MSILPYDMFLHEIAAAEKLERVYHKGQERIWDGRAVLGALVEQHGTPSIDPSKLEALKALFSVILWGELAAWKISAELALRIVPLEPKLAATSQVHDEARHFYVMRDYLNLLGYTPAPLQPAADRLLSRILLADSLPKKLLGMQLMVEPVALAIFHAVRTLRVEPVLSDLLAYYEIDEARHVALGINYLPTLLAEMSWREKLDLWQWQLRLLFLQVDELKALSPALKALGIDPLDLFRAVERRQLEVMREMFLQAGMNVVLLDAMRSAVHLKRDLALRWD